MNSPTSIRPTIPPVRPESPARTFVASALLVAGLALGAVSGGRAQPVPASSGPALQIHSIEGKLMQPAGGGPLDGIVVRVEETGAATKVDSRGNYSFSGMAPGTYTMTASGGSYATLKITDVVVTADRILTLAPEEIPLSGGVRTVSATGSDEPGLQKLATYFVSSNKVRSYEGGVNLDIPRSSNDVQPYTIINQAAIEQSNRMNVGDFLQDQVSSNTAGLQYNQTPAVWNVSSSGASQVNLRGLSTTGTLMLVNGSRLPSVVFEGNEFQPNVNQIPLAAIDRVEILSSSASGIYGSSAVGGVINIILKKNFAGGQFAATYQNTFDTDSPTRTLSFYDSIYMGNTTASITLNYSDGKTPVRQDRPFVKEYFNNVLKNAPALFMPVSASTGTRPFSAGAVPNIALYTGTAANGFVKPTSATALILKNGTSLGSNLTYIPVGTSPTTSASTLAAGLLANAGKQNYDEAPSIYRGSQAPLLQVPQNKTVMLNFSHKFNQRFKAYFDLGLSEQKSANAYLPVTNGTNQTQNIDIIVPGNAPTNPFQQNVRISTPLSADDRTKFETTTTSRTAKLGVQMHLPGEWEAIAEYNIGRTISRERYGLMDFSNTTNYGAQAPVIWGGYFNPFVDTVAYDQNIKQYYGLWTFYNPTQLMDFTARASGPAFSLPAGKVKLTTGIGARLNVQDTNTQGGTFPSLPGTNGAPNPSNTPYEFLALGQKNSVKSVYLEATIPIISERNALRFVKGLEIQVAGRTESFNVISNPNRYTLYPYQYTVPQETAKAGRIWNKYISSNPTYGLKYTPVSWLILRGSYASGFRPPTYSQFGVLSTQPATTFTAATLDPKTGQTYAVLQSPSVLPNPDLKPQVSKNWGYGAIFQPQSGPLKDLRVSLDFYRIDEYNIIAVPSYLQALASPSLQFLIPRDPATGQVTFYTRTNVNVAHQYTSGYDLSVDYRLRTAEIGSFNFHAAGTVINHLKKPFVIDGSLIEYVGFANSGGAIKTKGNASLSWLAGKHWSFGWNTRYWAAYKVQGSPSDPQYNGAKAYTVSTTTLLPQSGPGVISAMIPSQMYHDMNATYEFGESKRWRGLLKGTSVMVGVNNVFDKIPPFDASSGFRPFYYSPYGSVMLRTYLVKLKKDF